mgnify:CR=1 FL=1
MQHALRAFTPRDQKAVKATASTMRQKPGLDIEAAITELAVGEALVSLLDEKGRPGITERVFVLPPGSQIGPITPAQRQALVAGSLVAGTYEKVEDRESAYEKLKGRAADGVTHASAWVNLLSIYALSNFPPHGTFSASKAAAYSLAQCLRAEMRPAGIRVINVFPGPIDEEWNQQSPPPKLAPSALANAVVKALRDGVEDVYPGDVAQEWLARWRDDPKVLERELAMNGG